MDLPFAKAGAAQQLRAIVVLQGASQNFAGTGRAAIDQGEHGAIKEPAAVGRTLLINAVAVLGFNNHIASEEVVGNGQPGAHQPAGVVAQIQHQSFDALGFEICQGFLNGFWHRLAELIDAQIPQGVITTAQPAAANGA